jgi:hypothetical protein
MLNQQMPTHVYHADWGSDPKKRWLCKAVREGETYTAQAPTLVDDHLGLIRRIRAEIGETGSAVVGFDFPVGIPARYAALIGVEKFKPFLLQLGDGDFADFYRISEIASEISKHRPFYPYRPGGTKQVHLWSRLGLTCMDDLRRKCELAHEGRRAAAPLFWTLGANQVGRAAIIGWRDVLVPALRSDKSVVLWPFDGSLDDLLKPGNIVIAETYPAECYGWFFPKLLKGKGKLEVRRRVGPALLNWARSANVSLGPELESAIETGFPDGDDAFDAAVGLFGMLGILLNKLNGRESGEPDEVRIRKLEGWILGQKVSPQT